MFFLFSTSTPIQPIFNWIGELKKKDFSFAALNRHRADTTLSREKSSGTREAFYVHRNTSSSLFGINTRGAWIIGKALQYYPPCLTDAISGKCRT